jgi:hypothetical protein
MATEVSKKIRLSISGGNAMEYEGYRFQISYEDPSLSTKTIRLLDGENSSISGKYLNIQWGFDENENYIYTSDQDDITKNTTTSYQGSASRFSIEESAASITKKIFIRQTADPHSWGDPVYTGTGQISEIEIEGNTVTPHVDDRPGVQELDEYGIKMWYATAPNGKIFKNPSYEFSTHNTGTRDTFTIKGVDIMNLEATAYLNINLSDNTEEPDFKIYGGTHSDKHGKGDTAETRQGKCYAVGIQQDGKVTFKKEYPYHNITPDFSDKVKLADPNVKSLGSIKDKWIGLKVAAWPDKTKNLVHIECYIDMDGLDSNGKPKNNWKPFFTVEDKGQFKGDPYLKLNGSANGGDDLFYMRVDTVTRKTKLYGLTVREITPPAV